MPSLKDELVELDRKDPIYPILAAMVDLKQFSIVGVKVIENKTIVKSQPSKLLDVYLMHRETRNKSVKTFNLKKLLREIQAQR